MSHVDHEPPRSVPRVSFLPFSISGCMSPSFHSQVLWKRPVAVAMVSGSLTLGFGYPLGEMAWLPHPWRSFSTSNALGLNPSELFSSLGDRSTLPGSSLRSCASDQNLTTLIRRFSGLLPPTKPCPLLPPEGLDRVGTFALLGFPTSKALPLSTVGQKHLPSDTPLSSLLVPGLTHGNSMDRRVFRPTAWRSPITGAGLLGLLDLNFSPTLSANPHAADYFFISKFPGFFNP
jgi:hypothetical protein